MAKKSGALEGLIARLSWFRASIAKNIPGPQNQSEKVDIAASIIEDVAMLLFLIAAGRVNSGQTRLSTTDFLSAARSRGTGTIAEVGRSLAGKADPMLFHGQLFDPQMLAILDATSTWQDLLEYFNGFRWVANEFDETCTGDVHAITPAIFSTIHEHERVLRDPGGEKKRKGIFYTPATVSRYICGRCITQYLAARAGVDADSLDDLVKRLDACKLEKALSLLAQVRVLDPSCGSGEFLLTMADVLFALKARLASRLSPDRNDRARDVKSDIVSNNIFGAELSVDAISAATKRLWLWASSSDDDDDDPTEAPSIPSLKVNIVNGNALIGWLDEDVHVVQGTVLDRAPISAATTSDATARISRALESQLSVSNRSEVTLDKYLPLHWRHVFHDLFEKDGGFDIVVGNPPYVFVRGRNFDEIELSYFSRWYFRGYSSSTKGKARQSGKVNAFGLFIARSINLLKDGGILGFIVPNTLLRTTTNDIIRQFITSTAIVREIVDLQDGVFDGVVASTIVLMLEKGTSARRQKRTIVKHRVEDLLAGKYARHEVNQERFPLNPACTFDIHVDDKFFVLFSTMRKDAFALIDACNEIIEGLVTRRDDELFTGNPSLPNAKKLLRGKDIDRYKIDWRPGQYIIYDPEKLHRARPVNVHEARVKLLAQRIGGGTYPLRVAYDDKQHYFFASINAIILKESGNGGKQRYKYILAILNSALMNAYYLLNFSNLSALTVNVSKTFLGALPIKMAAPATRGSIERIVDYLLFLNEHGREEGELIDFFDKDLLDAIVFDLYVGQEGGDDLFGSMLSLLHEIDPDRREKQDTIATVKEAMARITADRGCQSWLSRVQRNADFKAVKRLFEERVDSSID
ncbi:MAG: N-6 DNA methylase [Candidatus Lokiarchaeota archaeon]|nr:N-6 DNA methylase [Candidatus Lokiarchaeota archaeon]